jgi:glycerol-3-phosphate O-acyltransferase/dihydroxyacetone phosphate acyltransferase
VAWISVNVFFRRFAIVGKEHLRDTSGPIIVVVNHPSTLMDVLAPGALIPRVMFFLANYSLFKNPISNWLLSNLYAIPVKRKEDVAEGEDRNNDEAFQQCYHHLEKGGALFIAPEGVSWMNRFVRPLKTGTARIALGAEQRQNGQLGLRILPVGMSYNAPNLFRSNLVMQVGAPVDVSQWLDQWSKDPIATVDKLTLHLENTLKSLTVHTENEQGERLLNRIETALHEADPLPLADEHQRSQVIARRIVADLPGIKDEEAYYEQLEKDYIKDTKKGTSPTALDYFILVLGFPVFLAGMVFWFLPCFIPWWFNKRLKLYIGYSSTVKVLLGFFVTFPLTIWAVGHVGRPYYTEWWHFPAVLICFAWLGLFCERYLDRLISSPTIKISPPVPPLFPPTAAA